ncbi:MAG: pyridoxal phosphate-dependent aminotransferase [Anaerolineae bacterium]
MNPAQRLAGLQESVIREMTRLAYQHDAINLSQGYPDFPAPEAVKQAAIDAIRSDYNQYSITWGRPATRQAIADRLRRQYGMDWIDPDQHVTVTCGVTEAIVVSLMGIVNPGDEVVVIEPFHENFVPAVAFAGARPVFVPLEPPDYRLDPDRLRQSFGPRTRAILVNTPHNPTGRVFTREELTAVADLCQEFDAIAVTDEIYEYIIYDGLTHLPMATLPGMAERTITTGGFSKTYAVTGWRLGYAVAQEPWSTALRTVHDYTTICAPTPFQEAAVAALALPDSYYAALQAGYTDRRDQMIAILNDVGFKATPPEGAYYVMADFSDFDFDGDDTAFARWMATQARVAVVPGSSFYHIPELGKSSVRFAFPKRLETLELAGERLRAALEVV